MTRWQWVTVLLGGAMLIGVAGLVVFVEYLYWKHRQNQMRKFFRERLEELRVEREAEYALWRSQWTIP